MVRYHLPCQDCGSSDALCQYDDGTYCFSCGRARKKDEIVLDKEAFPWYNYLSAEGDNSTIDISLGTTDSYNLKFKEVKETTKEMIELKYPYRGLHKDTFDSYGVYARDNWLVFPRGPAARDLRSMAAKDFRFEGDSSTAPLFGMDVPAQGTYLTLTEGQMDAMSVYQMLGSKYPCWHLGSATTAVKNAKRYFKEINAFERIYLCFDSDEPGSKLLSEVASMFNPNKVYHVKMEAHKDANEYLMAGHARQFTSAWWNARPYLPVGIIGDYDSIFDIIDAESQSMIATYPFEKMQAMTYGIRSSEVVLFTAQEKVGKTEILRSIEHHLLKTTDYNIGIIHLEESEKRTIQGLVGYELSKPVHLPDSGVSNEEMKKTWVDLTGGKSSRCFLYKHFGSDDAKVILDNIRYLVAACGCKFIFLDHITMLVTGFESENERKTLDYLSTQLAMMTRELDFTLFLVSHVNDDGKTRGSRNISKIADLIIHLDRDIEAASMSERNKTEVMIKGNRFAGLSGPSSVLMFDQGTFKYEEIGHSMVSSEAQQEISGPQDQGSDSGSDTLWAQASREEEGGSPFRETDDGLHETTQSPTTEALRPT